MMKKDKIICIFLFFFISVTIFSTVHSQEYDAVCNYKIWECKVTDRGVHEKVKKKITIYNERGLKESFVWFNKNKFKTLENVKCDVLDSNGKKIYSRKQKEMTKLKGFGASFELYNDNVLYYTELSAPEYPYSIEFSYEQRYKSLFFWNGADILEDVPVEEFTYHLEIDKDITFNFQAPKVIEQPLIEEKGKKIFYTWSGKKIEPFDFVNYEPQQGILTSLKIVAHKLSLNGYQLDSLTWKQIGLWYNKLAETKYKDLCEEIEISDALDYAKRKYNKLISSNRYVAVSMGIGGWQPEDASTTLSCGYGDCKGLSTLLISQLKNEFIKIYPVLVLTRSAGKIDPHFPELGFNHLIAMAIIEQDTIWMDPTCSSCPFGEVPWVDENINMLVVTDSGGVLLQSPSSKSEDNQIVSHSTLYINSPNDGSYTVTIKAKGNIGQRLRNMFGRYDVDEILKYVKNDLLPQKLRCNSILWNYKNIDSINYPFIIEISAKVVKPIKKMGNEIFIQPGYLNYSFFSTLDNNTNEDEIINFHYPKSVIDSSLIRWGDEIKSDIVNLPAADSIQFSSGCAILKFVKIDNNISIVKETNIFDYYLSGDNLEQYKDFIQKYSLLKSKKIVLQTAE